MTLPRRTQSHSGKMALTFEGMPDGPFAGDRKWRGVSNVEHNTLCRAFGLDPVRFFFDVSSTMRGVGSMTGAHRESRGQPDGFVFMAGRDRPVARLRVVRDGERLWDHDVLSARDYEVLNRTW